MDSEDKLRFGSLLDNPICKSEPFTKGQAWITILMLTNHKDGYIKVKNGEMIKIERGECGYSELALSDIFSWSRGKVKRFLKLLENEKMIQQKIRSNRNIIAILNYEIYQDSTVNDTVNDTVNGHLTDINNNDKNKTTTTVSVQKNKNATPPEKVFKKPTLEEVENYIKEKNLSVDGEKFFNYYESIGWKVGRNPMKSWQSALNYWQRTEKKEQKEEESWSEYVDRVLGGNKNNGNE